MPTIIAKECWDTVMVRPGRGAVYNVLGHEITVLADADRTGGAYTLFETVVPPGNGTPPHVHVHEDELFYVLEGMLGLEVAGETVLATPGSVVYIPRAIPHGFRNIGVIEARMLTLATPGGIEECFAEMGRLAPDADYSDVLAVSKRHGILPPDALAPKTGRKWFLRGPGDAADCWNIRGERVFCLATSEETGGFFSLFMDVTPTEGRVPSHIHTREAQGFYVLDGAVDILLGDRSETLSAGALAHLPKNVPHAYQNAQNAPTRMLIISAPGGYEMFLDDLCQLPSGLPDRESAVAIAGRHGIRLGQP